MIKSLSFLKGKAFYTISLRILRMSPYIVLFLYHTNYLIPPIRQGKTGKLLPIMVFFIFQGFSCDTVKENTI
jgi:hypothetical protein